MGNKLQDIINTPRVNEIMINGPEEIFIEKNGQMIQVAEKVTPEEIQQLVALLLKELNKSADKNKDEYIIEGQISSLGRVNIIFPPLVLNGPVITIRKYSQKIEKITSETTMFGLTPQTAIFLKHLIKSRFNILLSGGTGTGKTTLLNMMIDSIPLSERIITIEDTRELQKTLPNIVQLFTCEGIHITHPISMMDLVKNALRMRPDRIIIGEVRGVEVATFLQATNTGHDGSMCSIHASSAIEAIKRVEMLYMMNKLEIPLKAIRNQISMGIHFIVQLTRTKNFERKIEKIIEITGIEGDQILTQTIAELKGSILTLTGIVPQRIDELVAQGLPEGFFR